MSPAALEDREEETQHSSNEYATSDEEGAVLNEHISKAREIINQYGGDDLLDKIKIKILGQLTGKIPVPAVGVEGEIRKIYNLVEQTISSGEGNSCLVVGPISSGKSLVVNQVLADMKMQFNNEFITIRLNGQFHTDDRSALKEIARQMAREMRSIYRSQGYEFSGKDAEFLDQAGSVSQTLDSILGLLKLSGQQDDGQRIQTAVIFVLDHFDRFTTHPRQLLLYNLFDIAQSHQAPVAVLGLSTRVNCTAMLEKRVRSRFSHRVIQMPGFPDFDSFWNVCRQRLLVDDIDAFHQQSSSPSKGKRKRADDKTDEYARLWNSWPDALIKLDDDFRLHLEQIYATSGDPRRFYNSCLQAVDTISQRRPLPLTSDIVSVGYMGDGGQIQDDADIEISIAGLSDVEIQLLISCCRAQTKLDSDPVNFKIVYDEYIDIAQIAKIPFQSAAASVSLERSCSSSISSHSLSGSRIWSRDLARYAWDSLLDKNLIVPATLSALAAMPDMLMVTAEVSLLELQHMIPPRSKDLRRWARL